MDSEAVSRDFNSSRELLHQQGYRLTPQRYALFQVLQESGRHLSVDEIVARVKATNPCVSVSTVYRNLHMLLEAELIQEQYFPLHGAQPHYEVAKDSGHHHMVCQKCRGIFHFSHTFPEQILHELEQQHHFRSLRLALTVEGVCEVCMNQQTSSERAGDLSASSLSEQKPAKEELLVEAESLWRQNT
ncbi:MAG TPA: Fur family transcriptional regulator [Ktedonobacteraceae bacterium]|nr:Fur family transcriptional regulator [Ktedonobacteraceae bacterium]